MTGFALVSTTVANRDDAKRMAHVLVEARLAACVQISEVASIYRWAGAVEEAREQLLTCKIVAADFDEVERVIRANHAYEVPEIVMTPIVKVGKTYSDWLSAAVER